ncbi:MAG: hypothetical protein Q7T89_16745, partial [Anaerolineales bacterium]|nr:hypothetical protein [Anaerolineales bacterium]
MITLHFGSGVGVRILGVSFFAANDADFHELIKKNPRKLAKFAAKVLGVFKKLTHTLGSGVAQKYRRVCSLRRPRRRVTRTPAL